MVLESNSVQSLSGREVLFCATRSETTRDSLPSVALASWPQHCHQSPHTSSLSTSRNSSLRVTIAFPAASSDAASGPFGVAWRATAQASTGASCCFARAIGNVAPLISLSSGHVAPHGLRLAAASINLCRARKTRCVIGTRHALTSPNKEARRDERRPHLSFFFEDPPPSGRWAGLLQSLQKPVASFWPSLVLGSGCIAFNGTHRACCTPGPAVPHDRATPLVTLLPPQGARGQRSRGEPRVHRRPVPRQQVFHTRPTPWVT